MHFYPNTLNTGYCDQVNYIIFIIFCVLGIVDYSGKEGKMFFFFPLMKQTFQIDKICLSPFVFILSD